MLKKEVESLNPNSDQEDEDIKSDIDLYEYEEQIPDEESRKNRRYDPVDNFEYQLPKDFQVFFFICKLVIAVKLPI